MSSTLNPMYRNPTWTPSPRSPQFPGEGLREWTFHTHRVPRHGEGNGFITLFGYDQGFCKEEQVPERVARLDATHVFLKSHILVPGWEEYYHWPQVDLNVRTICPKTRKDRCIFVHELIELVICDEWEENVPNFPVKWRLTFPQGEKWGEIRHDNTSDEDSLAK